MKVNICSNIQAVNVKVCTADVFSIDGSSPCARRLRMRQLQSNEVLVEYEVVVEAVCIDFDCENPTDVQEIANAVFTQVTGDLRGALEDGSFVNSLKETSTELATLLAEAVASGEFSAVVVPILALISKWYPDWNGRSDTCKNDGKEPMYMKIFGTYYEKSVEACCQAFFHWNLDGCIGEAVSAVGGYYPNWGKFDEICLNDTETMPDYMRANPSQWLYSDVESCCKRYYNYAYDECLAGSSGNEFTVVGSSQWYVDYVLAKCVKDCEDDSDPQCGGLAEDWEELGTLSDCCDRLWWIDRNDCSG